MKQLIYLMLSMYLLSCAKPSSLSTPMLSTFGTIQYKLNGNMVTMDNANLLKGEKVIFTKQLHGIGLPQTRYLLYVQKEPNNFVTFSLVTDSLEEITYHYDSASVNNNFAEFTFDLDDNGQQLSLYFSTDKLDINISSYKNSTISGTFAGRMSVVTGSLNDYKTRGSVIITEGEFKNVPVSY